MLLLDATVENQQLGNSADHHCSKRIGEDQLRTDTMLPQGEAATPSDLGECLSQESSSGICVGRSSFENSSVQGFSGSLAAIFSNLVMNHQNASDGKPKKSETGAPGEEEDQQEDKEIVPEEEEEEEEESFSPLSLPLNSPTTHSPSPVSTSSSRDSRSSFAGIIKGLLHGRLSSSKQSFKFPSPDSYQRDEHDANRNNLSPTTVLPQTPTLNSILPFPASFPAVRTPMEALILADNFSFSQAVPESPQQLHAVSPLSFDAGSPVEHLLPGRYSFFTETKGDSQKYRARSGPQRLHSAYSISSSSPWGLNKSISFNSNGDLFLPKKFNSVVSTTSTGHSSKSFVVQQPSNNTNLTNANCNNNNNMFATRSSSNGSNSNTNTSSEFSIDLSGRLSGTPVELNSSRYIDLDIDKNSYNNSNNNVYDVKSDIRSRVEEVVRSKDESKFTFSPVASSFLFPKSVSQNTSSSGSLDGFIDFFQPEQRMSRSTTHLSSSLKREGSRKINTRCFHWIVCCTKN